MAGTRDDRVGAADGHGRRKRAADRAALFLDKSMTVGRVGLSKIVLKGISHGLFADRRRKFQSDPSRKASTSSNRERPTDMRFSFELAPVMRSQAFGGGYSVTTTAGFEGFELS